MGMQLTVHCSRFELSCGDLIVKQQIDLAKCPILSFREPEPAPDVAEEICASIEKSYRSQYLECQGDDR